jgi:hypothetical protein
MSTTEVSGGEKTTAWVLLLIALAANAAGYFLNLWSQFGWYDEVVHTYTTFALTLVLGIYLYGAVLTGALDHGFLLVLTIAGVGLAVGALWEIAEWAYDQWFAQGNAIKGKMDTIIDLILDTVGALIAGMVAKGMVKD